MSYLETIKGLKSRVKKSLQSHDELLVVFRDYQDFLKQIPLNSPEYRISIQSLREELPDLERIAIKKHDPVLKGRLIDALDLLGQLTNSLNDTNPQEDRYLENGQTEQRVRNMPNLGMS